MLNITYGTKVYIVRSDGSKLEGRVISNGRDSANTFTVHAEDNRFHYVTPDDACETGRIVLRG